MSLDTLEAEKFQIITRRDLFTQVKNNIDLLIDQGIHVKVNVVVMQGLTMQRLLTLLPGQKTYRCMCGLLNLCRLPVTNGGAIKCLAWQDILTTIEQRYSFLPLKGEANDTAKSYIVPGHAGTFAVISTMTSPFCSTCNRMRLTADGKLKNCLFSKRKPTCLRLCEKAGRTSTHPPIH